MVPPGAVSSLYCPWGLTASWLARLGLVVQLESNEYTVTDGESHGVGELAVGRRFLSGHGNLIRGGLNLVLLRLRDSLDLVNEI